jgi:hypothetical protein
MFYSVGDVVQHLVTEPPSAEATAADDVSAIPSASSGPPESLAREEAAANVKSEATTATLSATQVLNDLASDISEQRAITKHAEVKDLTMKAKSDEQKEDLMMDSTHLRLTEA